MEGGSKDEDDAERGWPCRLEEESWRRQEKGGRGRREMMGGAKGSR